MKTRLLAMLAVFAMVFAGAVVAIDDQADAAAFDSNSVIDAYARSTNTSHAIHYNTDGGMLRISFSATDYATLTTPDVAVQVIKDSETPVVYDPVSKAQDIYVNIGALGSTSTTVKIANHATADFTSALSFELKTIAASNVTFKTAVTPASGQADDSHPSSLARDTSGYVTPVGPTGYTFLGFSKTEGSVTAEIASGATLENIIMGSAWTAETPAAVIYEIWASGTFTVAFDFNKPAFAGNERFVNDAADSTAEAALLPSKIADASGTALADTKALIGGTNYVLADSLNFTLKGYTFAGWYTAQNGGIQVTKYDDASVKSIQTAFESQIGDASTAGTLTLYAHWTSKNVTITYDLGTTGEGFTYTGTGWNTDEATYDSYGKVLSVADLQSKATSASKTLSVTDGYVFSHWKISTTEYAEGQKIDITALDSAFTGAITFTPVFDYKVTVTNIGTNDVNFQSTGRTSGYEFLVKGSETTFNFDVVYDNLLYDVTAYSVTGGTAAKHDMQGGEAGNQDFTVYANGKVSAQVDSINAPITITLTFSANTYKVTAKVGDAAAESDGNIVVVDNTVTATWTNVVPNGKAGLITFASMATTSYIYAVTTTASNVEISKVSDKVFRIVPGSSYDGNPIPLALTATAADKNTPIAAFYIDEIANTGSQETPGKVVAYITGERSEVPAGTFAVSGTVYKTEGDVTTYSVLTGSGTQSAVEQPGVHSGAGAFVENKSVGSGYNEYRIVFTTSDNYNVYAAKVTFTPTDGSAISTAEAIVG